VRVQGYALTLVQNGLVEIQAEHGRWKLMRLGEEGRRGEEDTERRVGD
jgi:hypothetical protein